MGVVYEAEDRNLGRHVALKFLTDEVANDTQEMERLRREARSASALNHPNICTIYDIGEESGKIFIAMEYLQGRTLAELIDGGPVGLDRILALVAEIADALNAAHSKHIIHGDIKPGNIFVTESGHAKVLDFGLARIAQAGTTNEEIETVSKTQSNSAAGTLPYMSPEQLRAERLDCRTDIFSLGIVIYEMATGHRPFCGNNSAELVSSILRDRPQPITELRVDLPVGLQRIVERCMAKVAADRYPSSRDVYDAINHLQVELTSGFRGASVIGRIPEHSIAVLPFTNLSTDPENEFFADGIAEEIINALAQISPLHVAARTSSFSFKNKHLDLRIIGERLGVRTVLEGSVRRAGNRLRIMAQLISVSDGYHLWSERYDREMKDIFEIQDDIARSIADRLQLALEGRPQDPRRAGTRDLGAYQLYLKGRTLLYRRGYAMLRAKECFERAVILDPEYAQAWAGLADSHQLLGFWGFARPDATMPQGKEAAQRAVSIDPSLAEGHSALACAHLWWDWEPRQAEREFLRALEQNPRYIQARALYAHMYLQFMASRIEESIAQAKQAVESDPLSAYASTMLAMTYATAGSYPEALHHARRAVELDVESFLARWTLQNSLQWCGKLDEAVAIGEMVVAMSGRHPFAVASLASTYFELGKRADSLSLYRELLARSERQYVAAVPLSLTAAATGDLDNAVQHLREGVETREPFVILLSHWPSFKRLCQDSRFDDILPRMTLK
jgi:serine/threonine-protein kinase